MVPKALLDTNIFLEILFAQPNQKECLDVLKSIQHAKVQGVVTNFTLFSIGIIAFRKKVKPEKVKIFFDLLKGLLGLEIFHVPTHELARIYSVAKQTGLDFEDAIQYVSVKQLKIPIMTYDQDFFKTDLKSITPRQFLS